MLSKNLGTTLIQEFVFFQLISNNWASNGNENNTKSNNSLAEHFEIAKEATKKLGGNLEELIIVIEHCTEMNAEKIPADLKTLDLQLTGTQEAECKKILQTFKNILVERISAEQTEFESAMSTALQSVMKNAHAAFSNSLTTTPALADKLKNRMELWKSNLSNNIFKTPVNCLKQIKAIEDKLLDSAQLSENEITKILCNYLELTKKIINAIHNQKITLYAIANTRNPLLGSPKEILQEMLLYLPVHDIVKFKVLCKASQQIFTLIEESIFKIISKKDFPEQQFDSALQQSYFSFYKQSFNKKNCCYLALNFSTEKDYINHMKLFEDDFPTEFAIFPLNGVYRSPEELKKRLQLCTMRGDEYYGYVVINLPFDTAKKFVEKKEYQKLFLKVTRFVPYCFSLLTQDKVSDEKELKVSYQCDSKKFCTNDVIPPIPTLSGNDTTEVNQDLTSQKKDCCLM